MVKGPRLVPRPLTKSVTPSFSIWLRLFRIPPGHPLQRHRGLVGGGGQPNVLREHSCSAAGRVAATRAPRANQVGFSRPARAPYLERRSAVTWPSRLPYAQAAHWAPGVQWEPVPSPNSLGVTLVHGIHPAASFAPDSRGLLWSTALRTASLLHTALPHPKGGDPEDRHSL